MLVLLYDSLNLIVSVGTIAQPCYIFATKAFIDNRKKTVLLKVSCTVLLKDKIAINDVMIASDIC